MRAQYVADAPRQPPQAVLPLANSIFEVMDSSMVRAPQRKNKSRAPQLAWLRSRRKLSPNRPA
jgi:hypothetical protein